MDNTASGVGKVNMDLRKLELKDAPLMLEWMHDPDVVGKLKGNFLNKTLADAETFIRASRQEATIDAVCDDLQSLRPD